MKEEKKKIINANIDAVFAKFSGLHSSFAYQAHELILLEKDQNSIDIDNFYSIIRDAYEQTKDRDRLTAFTYLRALSEVLFEELEQDAVHDYIRSLFSYSEELEERAPGKVSYLRNKFTEKAFDKFARYIDDAKILHVGSFEESCEAVYNGICEYCILPTENSTDGRLSAFHKLIRKYDLHIMASTFINIDGTNTTLTLLSRDTDFMKLGDITRGRMFEFGINCSDTSDIGGIINFASSFGLRLISIHSMKGEEETSFTLLFSADGVTLKHIELMTFCLSAIYPAFTVTGLYRHIN